MVRSTQHTITTTAFVTQTPLKLQTQISKDKTTTSLASLSNAFDVDLTTHQSIIHHQSSLLLSSAIESTSTAAAPLTTTTIPAATTTFEAQQLSPETTIIIFIIGIIPFIWASIEFWRRIAVGEPFGTGSDSVIIGEDNNPQSSRGRQVLGKDALIVAYILFGIAIGSVSMAVYSVVSSPMLPM
mmetsp:Transcript_13659/g.19902  ORF Transcript_13659/g.19902 Transcript_13659/m.19902 type:complete len:184 (+) Transcript_13659:1-552(+)